MRLQVVSSKKFIPIARNGYRERFFRVVSPTQVCLNNFTRNGKAIMSKIL